MATSQEDDLSMMAMKAPKVPTNWWIGQLLGIGAFGRVYRCYDIDTGYEYAVKMVKLDIPDAHISKEVQALGNEIKLLSTLQHERIVQYFGSHDDGEFLSIFLESMAGGSVKDLIDEIGELQESLVKKYSRQVLLGLAYLHNKRILHRDIKAANILRDTKGNVKLGDFGTSKRLQTICSDDTGVVGTPHWMAPEVINGEDYNYKADIWSLGCTIVEMLSRKPPFHEYGPIAVMFQIAKCKQPKYELPQSVSSLVEEFLLHTFQKIPDDRWSAKELLGHRFVWDEEAYGVGDDISISPGELDVNKEAVAGVVGDLSRPAGELDVNKGAVTGVVDDISRPAGELDVNKEAVAGVVDDLSRPAGELDVNEGIVAGVVDDISSTAGELDVNKGAVAGVVNMGEKYKTTITGNVKNLYQGTRHVVNSATDNLYSRTKEELDEELLYDVTDSNAFKSVRDVLDEHRIAFVVGSSRILRRTIALSCLNHYREMRVKVLSLSSLSANETAAMMDEGKKFVFLDEVFGLITLNERRFDQVFDVLKKVPSNRLKRNNRLVFTLTPLAYHTCRNRLDILLLNFNEMVIDLDNKDEFSEGTKFEILSNINSRVAENSKICLSKLLELSKKENPVFLECCTEFLRLRRYDINITQWFLQPMDVLIKEFMGLKDEWRKGYHVLVLVALCPEFGVSVKSVPKVMLNYMELIHHNYELGEINEICEQFIYSYLEQDFTFRYEMHRNAILGTIGNKEFLLANCPVSFIIAMDAIFVQKKFYREKNFQFYNDLSLLARRFVNESEENFSKLTNLNVGRSMEFMKIYDEECQRQHSRTSGYNHLYLFGLVFFKLTLLARHTRLSRI